MNKHGNKTIHSVTAFPGVGGEKLNQYHDYQYGREEGIPSHRMEFYKSFIPSIMCP